MAIQISNPWGSSIHQTSNLASLSTTTTLDNQAFLALGVDSI